MRYILGTVCFEEAKNVLNKEVTEAFGRVFKLLGEIAMISLMNDQKVKQSLENWVKYLDKDFIKKFD